MNALPATVTALASAQFWQVTVVCVLVAAATLLACRHRPHLAYLLWMLVVIKAITPPLIASPTGLFSWLLRQPASAVMVTTATHPTPAPTAAGSEPRLATTSATQAPATQIRPVAPALAEAPLAERKQEPKNPVLLPTMLLAVWIAGFCGLSAIVAAKWFRLRRLWRAEALPASEELVRHVNTLADRLGVGPRVRVLVSSAATTPAVFGPWRSTILLPAALVERMTPDELQPILAHELVHVRRRDPAAAQLQLAAQLLWWFHPFVWWANRQIRRERERACDEEVITGLGCRPADYARMLLDVLAAQPHRRPIVPLPGIGMFGVTAQRLEHITTRASQFHRRTPRAYYVLALFALVLLLPGAGLPVAAEPPAGAGPPAAADAKTKAPSPRGTPADSLELQNVTDADLADLARSKNLKSLSISNSSITQAGLKSLAGMKSLEHLALADCPALVDADLAPLRNLGSLRSLDLSFWISATAVSNVAQLGTLEKLTLTLFDLDPAAVEPLAGLTHLVSMSVESNESVGYRLDRVGQAQLQKIRLHKVPLGDALANVAGRMPHLQTVNLQAPLSNQGLAALVENQGLQSIALDLVEVDDRSLALVGRLTGLQRLVLRGPGKLSDAGLAPLAKLTHLALLELPAEGLTDRGLAHLAPLNAIEDLNLSGGKITGTGLAPLGRWQQLKTLTLSDSSFDDAGCRALPRFASLETLDLNSTQITDAGLPSIGRLAKLRSLNLVADAAVTDVGLASLKGLKNLRFVFASGTAVTGQGIAALKGAIPGIDVRGPDSGPFAYLTTTSFVRLEPADVAADASAAAEAKPGAVDPRPPRRPPALKSWTGPRSSKSSKSAAPRSTTTRDFPMAARSARKAAICQIQFPSSWKGTADDWKLLGMLDHPESLMLSVAADQLPSLVKVHFAGPIAGIMLELQSAGQLAGIDRLPACRTLWLGDQNLTMADYRRIVALAADVKVLTLRGAPVDGDSIGTVDEVVAEMAGHMQHLESFTSNEPLSAAGLQALGKFDTLKLLAIKTIAVAPADVEPLAHLVHLQTLNIGPSNIEVNVADRREQIPVGNAIARAVAGIPALRVAAIETRMSQEGLAAMAAAEKLQVLAVELDRLDDAALATVGRMNSLAVLHLAGWSRLSDRGLAPLGNLTRLVELNLPGQGISDEGLKSLAPLTALRALDLQGGQFTGTGLAALAGAKQFEFLQVAGSALDDAGCRLLPEVFPQLMSLDLSQTKITDSALKSLGRLANLSQLTLDGTKITDAGLVDLKPLVKLRMLQIHDTAVTEQGAELLRAAIPGLSVLGVSSPQDAVTFSYTVPFRTLGPGTLPGRDCPGRHSHAAREGSRQRRAVI